MTLCYPAVGNAPGKIGLMDRTDHCFFSFLPEPNKCCTSARLPFKLLTFHGQLIGEVEKSIEFSEKN